MDSLSFLRHSQALAALNNLGDVSKSNLNGRIAKNLLDALCNNDFHDIYLATLAALAPATLMTRVQGGVLPKTTELDRYGSDWRTYYSNSTNIAAKIVGDFEIGLYPISLNEWRACRKWALEYGLDMAAEGDYKPENAVTKVSWFDCVDWCNAKSLMEGLEPVYKMESGDIVMRSKTNGYRLPLESEWSWAAHNGILQALPFNESYCPWEWCWNVKDFIPRRVGETPTCCASELTIVGRNERFSPENSWYDIGFRVARSLEN